MSLASRSRYHVAVTYALTRCFRLRDYHLSVFWRLLRPEFVRERGTTLLGTATATSASTDTATNSTTHITAGTASTTSSTATAPVTPAEAAASDTSAVKESDINVVDKFKVMNLLAYMVQCQLDFELVLQ